MTVLPDPRKLELTTESPISVAVLTGFLGSGKTTLVKKLLALPEAADTAVVINEFGDIGIDHMLVESVDENIVVLPGGCLCCQAQGDLARALRSLEAGYAESRIPAFSRVIVETSGLADPASILRAFLTDPLRLSRYRFGGLVTVVDSVLGTGQLSRHPEAQAQAMLADRILLTKLDMANVSDELAVRVALGSISVAPIEYPANGSELLFQLFAGSSQGSFQCLPASTPQHSATFDSMSIPTSRRVDINALMLGITDISQRYGEKLLRLKGIVDVIGSERPVVIQAVQHVVGLPRVLDAPAAEKGHAIVAIFATEAGEEIRKDLAELLNRATPDPAKYYNSFEALSLS